MRQRLIRKRDEVWQWLNQLPPSRNRFRKNKSMFRLAGCIIPFSMDWSNFYTASAGASATLLGLLFVAIQINIGPLTTEPSSRWRALAGSTFYNYTLLFIFSLFMLFPPPGSGVVGYALLFVIGAGVYRLFTTWLPVWRGVFRGRGERLVEIAWWFATPLAVHLALAFYAFEILRGGKSSDVLLSIGFWIVGLFGIVLRNSWRLLVELSAERSKRG
ncbi:MAG TPA: hypothetical protein VGK81_12795 [Anaerolineae bacterium]